MIAKHIVNAAAHIEATDASAEMIAEAKRDNRSAKLDVYKRQVLDEAMAFTDAENELALREGMAELLKGKTVLMIAHRLYSCLLYTSRCV